MNCNVHLGEGLTINLGLKRIKGSCPAAKVKELLIEMLSEYGLNIDRDIVALSTDGASTMKLLGASLNAFHVICMAHTIHLVVCDVLYEEHDDCEDAETSDSEADTEDDNCEADGGHWLTNEETGKRKTFTGNLRTVLSKVKKIVTIFTRSPTKNDLLQAYVKTELGKELCLLNSVPTRWNSTYFMCERMLKLKKPIEKALIDIEGPTLLNSEWIMLKELCSVLSIFKEGVEALCRNDATILSSISVIEFVETSLLQYESNFAKKFADRLTERIHQRADNDIYGLVYFLHNGHTQIETKLFGKLSESQIGSKIVEKVILLELSGSHEEESEPEALNKELEDSSCSEQEKATSVAAALQIKIAADRARAPKKKKEIPLEKKIKEEIYTFKKEGRRGKLLEGLYQALLTVPPTSVESERAFSTSSKFCTKIRNRLSDEVLNALSVLKHYYNNNKVK